MIEGATTEEEAEPEEFSLKTVIGALEDAPEILEIPKLHLLLLVYTPQLYEEGSESEAIL
jgi:hypothetical protein